MFRYEAPNPYQPKSFFSSLFSGSSSKRLGKLILPAQLKVAGNIDDATLHDFAHSYGLVINTGIVGTHDHAMLDTIELKPVTEALKPVEEQYFIIKYNGNGMHYQDRVQDFVRDAVDLDSNVIGFNYRGVGNSVKQPEAVQDLITDGIAEVRRLLDQGVDSYKITLDGVSLGGGVATMVAHHFYKNDEPVYLWNDRSFSSLSKAAAGMFAPKSKGISSNIFTSTLQCSAWCVMAPSGWEADIAKAYNEIPAELKGYVYVAKESAQSDGDGVIDHPASLHKGVKKFEIDNDLHTGHKVLATHGMFGHNMARADLITKENPDVTGQDLFDHFVRSHRN